MYSVLNWIILGMGLFPGEYNALHVKEKLTLKGGLQFAYKMTDSIVLKCYWN